MRTSWNFQKSFNEFSYVLSYNTEKQKREYKIWYYVKLLAICSDNFGSHIIDKQNVIDENKNVRIYLWYLIQKKIYKFYSRIYDTIKFFVKFHKKSSNSQREINVFLHIFYAKWRKRLDERWISSECIKLNSKTLIYTPTISTSVSEHLKTLSERKTHYFRTESGADGNPYKTGSCFFIIYIINRSLDGIGFAINHSSTAYYMRLATGEIHYIALS